MAWLTLLASVLESPKHDSIEHISASNLQAEETQLPIWRLGGLRCSTLNLIVWHFRDQ